MMKTCYRISRSFIFYIAMALFTVFSVYLLFAGSFVWYFGGCSAYDNMPVIVRGLSMLMLIFALLFFFSFLGSKIRGKEEKGILQIAMAVGVCMFILQVVYVLSAKSLIRYDSLKIVDEAVALFSQPKILETDLEGYFARYSNNYAITILTHWIIKILRVFHVIKTDFSNVVVVLQCVNILFVDAAFVGCFAFIKKYFDTSKAVMFVVFMALNPLTYVWLPFYYTNTCSMAFTMWGIYLLYAVFDEENQKHMKRYGYAIFAGILFYVGYSIRATVIIGLIAAIVGLYYRGKKVAFKQFLILLLCFAVSFGVTRGISQKVTNHYLGFDNTDTAFPVTHWVSMGLNDLCGGIYNAVDEQNTIDCPTAKAKKDLTIGQIQTRAKELGILGVSRLYMKKLSTTFGDGAGGYHSELSISKDYGPIWQIVYGVHRDPVLIYTQVFYLLSILCSILLAVWLFQKRMKAEAFSLILLLLGSYLFQMIWEASTIYSIGTMYVNGCMVALGLPDWKEIKQAEVKNQILSKCKKYIPIVASLCGVLGLSGMLFGLFHTNYVEVSISVDQFLFQAGDFASLSENQTIIQTFESEKEFSLLSLKVRNLQGEYNDSVYLISLCDGEGNLLEEQKLYGNKAIDFEPYVMEFHNCPGISNYEIHIDKESGNDDLIFLYYDTGHYDTYTKGKMTGPMVAGDYADLLFSVYDREEK